MITTTEAPTTAATTAAKITMPGIPASVGCARNWVRQYLGDHPAAGDALVVVSELATNAVEHTTGRYGLHLETDGGIVRIEVTTPGSATTPAQQASTPDDEHGRGLFLVDAYAADWGIELVGSGDDTRCVVWANVKV